MDRALDVVLKLADLTGEKGANAEVCSAKSRLMTAAVANFMMCEVCFDKIVFCSCKAMNL